MRRSFAFLLVALMMGLAWAIRGHFGHENGAAWAGAIGTLAILVATRRPDWIRPAARTHSTGGHWLGCRGDDELRHPRRLLSWK